MHRLLWGTLAIKHAEGLLQNYTFTCTLADVIKQTQRPGKCLAHAINVCCFSGQAYPIVSLIRVEPISQ